MKLRNINIKLLYIGIALSIISQIPFFWNNKIISLVYTGSLFLFIIVTIFKEKFKIKMSVAIIFLPILINIIFLLLTIFTQNNYFNSNLFMPINMCCFFSIVGFFCNKYSNFNTLDKINKIIVMCTLVMAFFIFKENFFGNDWDNSSSYQYTAKNSAATIFLVAVIIIVIFFKDFNRFFAVLSMFFLSVVIIMTKSRANLVCLLIVMLYVVLIYIKNYKLKIFLITLIIGTGILLFMNDSFYNLIINKIFFNNRSKTDLSTITSGRNTQYDHFFKMIPKYWLRGTGGTYIECNILATLLSYGLLGGIPVIIYSFYPALCVLKKNKNKNKTNNKLKHLVFLLSIMLIVNGLFEELAPFGPGVKCFSLWFYFGFYIGNLRRKVYAE